jgi:hypothetical protein
LEFERVLESLHSGKCDCLLRIWWQRVLVISISSWMAVARCIFADTFVGYLDNPMSLLGIWSVLESLHLVKGDCLLRIWLRRALAISISSWMAGTRCILANIL